MTDWEIIHHDGSAQRTERLRVHNPDGWLFRTWLWSKEDGRAIALAFASDPPLTLQPPVVSGGRGGWNVQTQTKKAP